jgi:hypothetical protein
MALSSSNSLQLFSLTSQSLANLTNVANEPKAVIYNHNRGDSVTLLKAPAPGSGLPPSTRPLPQAAIQQSKLDTTTCLCPMQHANSMQAFQ